eukprot:TRINITY_DN9356_c0_g1_i1.p1 TRINITY_DN9356_c0_g1~~TRINITY_DN9356_c0_g1_i1.p1  ORF type:complete len:423 (+),score=65.99 TRINITY_DN9356_c0_g1_i1:164-1432(+)
MSAKRLAMVLLPTIMLLVWGMIFQMEARVADNKMKMQALRDVNKIINDQQQRQPGNLIAPREFELRQEVALNDRRIFISVAAFRDSECQDTLRSLFNKAKYPHRLFAGVVCQRDYSIAEEICVPPEWSTPNCTNCYPNNIYLHEFEAKDAKGPTYARYLASLLYKDQDYFMMIDSHNLFVQDWDVKLIDLHDRCDSPKCVLSVYPMGLTENDKTPLEGRSHVAFLCANSNWQAGGYPGPYAGSVYTVVKENRPQPYVGAGLVFGSSSILKEVPFDPHLPFMFHGEEVLITIRLWTHGYDFFSPGDNILYHHYYRKGKPRMESITRDWWRVQTESSKRIQFILQLKDGSGNQIITRENTKETLLQEIEKYGLGTKRTVEQYWKFSRLDPINRESKTANDYWCNTYKGRPPYSREWRQAAGYSD